jgi:hypothetical protein
MVEEPVAIQKGAAKVRTTEASGMYGEGEGEGEGKINIRSRTRIRSTLSNWGKIRGYPGSLRVGNPGVDKGR